MTTYIIVELEDGLSPVELLDGQKPEDAALAYRGILIDEGPYATLEEAIDAIDNMSAEEDQA